MSDTLKDLSRKSFTPANNSLESINAGSLQRIADATELMAKNHLQLQQGYDYQKERAGRLGIKVESLTKSNASLRGHITRLKNKLAALQTPATSTETPQEP